MSKRRAYHCEDCGKLLAWKQHGYKRMVCLDCALDRMVAAIRAMHFKSGVAYDRWEDSAGPNGRPPSPTTEE